MSKRKCGVCGLDPAEGFASSWTRETGEVFYCHGDDDGASCYERASWSSQRLPPPDMTPERAREILAGPRPAVIRIAAPTQDPTP